MIKINIFSFGGLNDVSAKKEALFTTRTSCTTAWNRLRKLPSLPRMSLKWGKSSHSSDSPAATPAITSCSASVHKRSSMFSRSIRRSFLSFSAPFVSSSSFRSNVRTAPNAASFNADVTHILETSNRFPFFNACAASKRSSKSARRSLVQATYSSLNSAQQTSKHRRYSFWILSSCKCIGFMIKTASLE